MSNEMEQFVKDTRTFMKEMRDFRTEVTQGMKDLEIRLCKRIENVDRKVDRLHDTLTQRMNIMGDKIAEDKIAALDAIRARRLTGEE